MKKLFPLIIAIMATICLCAQESYYDFKYGDLYYNITSDSTLEVTSSVSSPQSGGNYLNITTIAIPETITRNGKDYTVTSVGNSAFAYCNTLESVAISSSVTSLGDKAFIYCYNLNYLWLPNSIQYIGEWAFYACSKLTNIAIPNQLTHIQEYAFASCTQLNALVIPNSVVSIGAQAFKNCSALTNIAVPNSVVNIEENAFAYCISLDSVAFGNNVESIGDQAFLKCQKLCSVNIPQTVKHIGYSAFRDCASLHTITIPDSVTYVGEWAFYETGVYNDETNWENNVLYISHILIKANDDILGTYTIRDNTQLIADNAFIDCDNLDSIVIAGSVKNIGRSAFYGCNQLTHVAIPDSVIQIGKLAFYYCSALSTIEIGNNVESIDEEAFADCYNLDTITIHAHTAPSLGNAVFKNVDFSIPVYTPCGTQEAYKSSAWNSFSNIQEPLPIFALTVTSSNEQQGIVSVDKNTLCGAQLTASAHLGYQFVQWSDSVFDNPRVFTLTKDTTFTAEFAKMYSGKCGDDLYWSYEEKTQMLTITGTGEMHDYAPKMQPWFLFNEDIKKLMISNLTTSVGQNTFSNCSVLDTIVCLATTPPTVDGADSFAHYIATLYVPCKSLFDYQSHEVWGKFKTIHCIGENTSIHQIDLPSSITNTHKYFRDGQLLILRDGKYYNVLGQEQ